MITQSSAARTGHIYRNVPHLMASDPCWPVCCVLLFSRRSPALSCSGAWILLYAVEAAAIVSLMNRNPDQNQATELSSALSALPSRKMFPAPLTPVKDALANTLSAATTGSTLAVATIAGVIAEHQAQQAAAPAQLVAAPPGLSKELEKALEDIEAAAAGSSSGSSAGSSVLDAPVKESEQQQKQKQPKAQKTAPAGPIKQKEGLKRQQQQERDEAQKRISKRDQELKDRKAYLKNFWYAAGNKPCQGSSTASGTGQPA